MNLEQAFASVIRYTKRTHDELEGFINEIKDNHLTFDPENKLPFNSSTTRWKAWIVHNSNTIQGLQDYLEDADDPRHHLVRQTFAEPHDKFYKSNSSMNTVSDYDYHSYGITNSGDKEKPYHLAWWLPGVDFGFYGDVDEPTAREIADNLERPEAKTTFHNTLNRLKLNNKE